MTSVIVRGIDAVIRPMPMTTVIGTRGCTISGGLFPRRRGRVVLRSAEELDMVSHDLEFRPVLTALFILPGLELQPALDKNAAALLQILRGVFSVSPPEGNVDEGNFLLLLAVFILPDPIEGETKFGDRVA